jgi:hypothetical protein
MLARPNLGQPLQSQPLISSLSSLLTLPGVIPPTDLGLAQLILSQISSRNTFCFFAFGDAQCRERQRLLLKFTKFMDGHKISQAILQGNF